MRLFKPDCYAVITTQDGKRIDLSAKSAKTDRRLDMSFNCFHSDNSEPNTGECTIYNLSETNRSAIAKNDRIEVFAGYDGNLKLISVGDIQTISNRNPSNDWTTSITWGDGMRSYLESNFNKSYREGVKVSTIIDDVISTFGAAIKSVEIDKVLDGGLSVDGKSKDILNTLTRDYGLKWSIQDDEVQVRVDETPIDDTVIIINKDTGLLEFPQISEKGIDFVAQLNSDLRPNKLVNITSQGSTVLASGLTESKPANDNGLNIINTVRFVGDNFGGQFSALCNCTAYDNG